MRCEECWDKARGTQSLGISWRGVSGFAGGESGEVQRAKVMVLVDSHGKVLEAAPAGSDLVADAKSLTLPPIAWPDHAIWSLRTVEFRREGSKWVLDQSYVGLTADASIAH
ncbi:MAG TPA: hypothetical protein VMB03_13565 [Bryobacteraceae bacterium]|nr:hypothetical protein [Bryobacteraceae bacterium]